MKEEAFTKEEEEQMVKLGKWFFQSKDTIGLDQTFNLMLNVIWSIGENIGTDYIGPPITMMLEEIIAKKAEEKTRATH